MDKRAMNKVILSVSLLVILLVVILSAMYVARQVGMDHICNLPGLVVC